LGRIKELQYQACSNSRPDILYERRNKVIKKTIVTLMFIIALGLATVATAAGPSAKETQDSSRESFQGYQTFPDQPAVLGAE